MSKATPFSVRLAVVRTAQGLALWAAFGGLGECGLESSKDGSGTRSTSEAATDSPQTLASGQSGTEYDPSAGGGDRPSCPCGSLKNPLRATVLEVVGHIEGADYRPRRLGTVRLRVEELLGNTAGLEIGSEITSPWFGELPCFYGCASIAVGDRVLAFYRFPEPCISTDAGNNCPSSGTLPGSISLTPWADDVVLAQLTNGAFTLPVENLSLLESPACDAQIGSVHDRLGGPRDGDACYEQEAPPR